MEQKNLRIKVLKIFNFTSWENKMKKVYLFRGGGGGVVYE